MTPRISQLKRAIEIMHRCTAEHEQSVPVIELFGTQKVWEGVVESFKISGHPKTQRCYGWSFPENGETQFVTVLEIPPVNSAQTAVRASIVAGDKSK